MSKGGGIASGLARRLAETMAPGLRKAAEVAWEAREERRTAVAEERIVALAAKIIGPVEVEPYVTTIGKLAERWPEHQRVCIDIDGVTLNYWAGNSESPEALHVLHGVCVDCKKAPALSSGNSLESIGAALYSPTTAALRENYRCAECKKAAS